VTEWATELDLRLVNLWSSSTCVVWRGESIVELTWVNPVAVGRVLGWEVSRQETLSDHLFILMDVAVESRPRMQEHGRPSKCRVRLPRWGATHCDDNLMAATAIVVAWRERAPPDEGAETEVTRLRRDMQTICDACMSRAGVTRRAGEVYWWLGEITRLRERCSRARCRYTHARCRKRRMKKRWPA
jgi:hypothetical protein